MGSLQANNLNITVSNVGNLGTSQANLSSLQANNLYLTVSNLNVGNLGAVQADVGRLQAFNSCANSIDAPCFVA